MFRDIWPGSVWPGIGSNKDLKDMNTHIRETLEPSGQITLKSHAKACYNAILEVLSTTFCQGKNVLTEIPYRVVMDCAEKLPESKQQLRNIGMTEHLLKKLYGDVILNICQAFIPKRRILKIQEEISQRKDHLKYMEQRDAYSKVYNAKSKKLDEKIEEVNQLKHDNQSYKATNNKLNADLNAAKEEIKKLKIAVADSVLAENDRLKSQIEHLKKEKKDQEKFIVELTGKLQAKNENN